MFCPLVPHTITSVFIWLRSKRLSGTTCKQSIEWSYKAGSAYWCWYRFLSCNNVGNRRDIHDKSSRPSTLPCVTLDRQLTHSISLFFPSIRSGSSFLIFCFSSLPVFSFGPKDYCKFYLEWKIMRKEMYNGGGIWSASEPLKTNLLKEGRRFVDLRIWKPFLVHVCY